MRNRAKCKLCLSIIESFHLYDLVSCKCGEISIEGGKDNYKCMANNWCNFIRVDDLDNEIIPVIKDEAEEEKPKKQELISMLDEMISNIEKLPENAMATYINHYDYCAFLILMSSILKCEEK